ncbi:MAG: hypothetical protein IJC71_07125, partial [Clostridia bacterium]|nr:hypothetical protein [Clostridia bacterium]
MAEIGGDVMRTAFFYALRELYRRRMHFADIIFLAGSAVFVPVTLYGYTEAQRGNGGNRQFVFFFVLTAVLLYSMAVMSLADKYDKFSGDYRILHRLGLNRGHLLIIQVVEMTAVFICASAVFYPLSIAFLAGIIAWYNRMLDAYPWMAEERFAQFSLPEKIELPHFCKEILLLLLAVWFVLLLASTAAYLISGKTKNSPVQLRLGNGLLPGEECLERRNDLSAYARAVSGRMRRQMKHGGKTA